MIPNGEGLMQQTLSFPFYSLLRRRAVKRKKERQERKEGKKKRKPAASLMQFVALLDLI